MVKNKITLLSKIKYSYNKKGSNNLIKKTLFVIAFILLIGFLMVIGGAFWLLSSLPSMEEIKNITSSEASVIYDKNGQVLYTIYGDENRKVIDYSEMPEQTIYAVISLEDENFFNHKGVDYMGVFRAILGELMIINYKGGGSTLTQQFVKNKFLTNERTYLRKIKEMVLSAKIEASYSKEDIIAMYLNQIPFGASIYGIQQASNKFFGKNAKDLNLVESAIIASIPNATTYYSPYGDNKQSSLVSKTIEDIEDNGIKSYDELVDKFGKDVVSYGLLPKEITYGSGAISFYLPGRASHALDVMNNNGYITIEQKNQALKELNTYVFKEYRENILAPHFVMYVRSILEDKYGKSLLSQGGLKIYTTLDFKSQTKAEEIIAKNANSILKKFNASNQSLITTDTRTGEIIAMVGSKDFFSKEIDGQVNVTRQKRLAGSTFKVFPYTAFFLGGYSPSTIIYDVETDFGEGGIDYTPKNYDGTFMGPVTARAALGHSRNIPAIKAGIIGGLQKTYDLATSMGIRMSREADWYGASMCIGTAEVTAQELLDAYMVFANGGKKIKSTPILKVVTKDGIILEEFKPDQHPVQVIPEEAAFMITDILSDKNARGFGWNNSMQLSDRPNAIKTGTSNKKILKPGDKKGLILPQDGWIVGFTPQYTTVVWSGNNDGSPMSINASGLGESAPTWMEFMTYLHKGLPVENFVRPNGIKYIKISALTGKLPTKDTPPDLIRTGIFGPFNIPTEYDDSIRYIKIDKVSGLLPTEFTPEDAITEIPVVRLHTLKPNSDKWEAGLKKWLSWGGPAYLKRIGLENAITEIPTESDNIHTSDNIGYKPTIKISSPADGAAISNKGFSVLPEVDTKFKTIKVEFYFDGELADTSFDQPFLGKISPSNDLAIGSVHKVTVKVFDSIYNTNTQSINVTIGKDSDPPVIEIVKPFESQNLIAGSSYTIKILAYDTGSDIDKILIYLNNKKIGLLKNPPFSLNTDIPLETGKHELKAIAFDKENNSQESVITFNSISR